MYPTSFLSARWIYLDFVEREFQPSYVSQLNYLVLIFLPKTSENPTLTSLLRNPKKGSQDRIRQGFLFVFRENENVNLHQINYKWGLGCFFQFGPILVEINKINVDLLFLPQVEKFRDGSGKSLSEALLFAEHVYKNCSECRIQFLYTKCSPQV